MSYLKCHIWNVIFEMSRLTMSHFKCHILNVTFVSYNWLYTCVYLYHYFIQQAGFKIQYDCLLTVFSSSAYCGGTNEAACILVDADKIRTIRLDTKQKTDTHNSNISYKKPQQKSWGIHCCFYSFYSGFCVVKWIPQYYGWLKQLAVF